MTGHPQSDEIEEVRQLLAERLNLGDGNLADRLRRAGRDVPRRVRREIAYLAEVELLSQNPRLARQIDAARLVRAHAATMRWLRGIDPRERRKTRLLNIAAMVAFNLLLLFALAVYLHVSGRFA
jgi:hypothetical protein